MTEEIILNGKSTKKKLNLADFTCLQNKIKIKIAYIGIKLGLKKLSN